MQGNARVWNPKSLVGIHNSVPDQVRKHSQKSIGNRTPRHNALRVASATFHTEGGCQ